MTDPTMMKMKRKSTHEDGYTTRRTCRVMQGKLNSLYLRVRAESKVNRNSP
jgi:hypothetical protein